MNIARILRQFLHSTAFLTVLFFVWSSRPAHAQFVYKYLQYGSAHAIVGSGGTEEANVKSGRIGLEWPAIRPYAMHNPRRRFQIGALNFTDESGETFAAKVIKNGSGESAADQIFTVRHDLIVRRPTTQVTVDGVQSFFAPAPVDEVDAAMKADAMIVNEVNTQLGVTFNRKVMQFSNEFHDSYFIHEYTFTNTGNTDDDAEIEIPDQTLEDVYYWEYSRYNQSDETARIEGGSTGWGQFLMSDAIGFAENGDFEPDFVEIFEGEPEEYRGFFYWHGFNPAFSNWNSIGSPAITHNGSLAQEDTVGRLSAHDFFGRSVIHADVSPSDNRDDLGQPRTIAQMAGNYPNIKTMDPFSRSIMLDEYEMMTWGRELPHHADRVMPPEESPGLSWKQRMARQQVDGSLGAIDGWQYAIGFGPYTLGPGDSVNIVLVEGINGLSQDAALEIGKAYKAAWQAGDENRLIEFDANADGVIRDDERMGKNEWVMTSRDSLFQVFKRAHANFNSGYNIPRQPDPPSEFQVTSGTDRILLEWESFPESGTVQGWEIYRAQGRQENPYVKIHDGMLEPGSRSFEDSDVLRGVGYYYYIQAVGDINTDPTGHTPTGVPLRSNRYYTQTYDPAFLKREEGTLAEFHIVPSPYSLTSDQNLRWPDVQDQVAFLDIPGNSTISIFTEMGELVNEIEHDDGSGDAFWNLRSSSGQLVVSGIYLVIVQDHDTGGQTIKKFAVIR